MCESHKATEKFTDTYNNMDSAIDLCRSFGIDPDVTSSVVISFNAHNFITVTTTKYVTETEFRSFVEEVKKYRIVEMV
jgi:hypothetical protein